MNIIYKDRSSLSDEDKQEFDRVERFLNNAYTQGYTDGLNDRGLASGFRDFLKRIK